MTRRRVAITGIGAITPIGHGAVGLWNGVRLGRSVVDKITRFDATPFRSTIAAEISDFDARDHITVRDVRRLDRFAQLGVVAAQGAVSDANLNLENLERRRVGVSLGSALGGVPCAEEHHASFLAGGLRNVPTALAIAVYGGASGANIAIHMDLRGPNLANSSSCASGAIALGEALRVIQRDEADIMLAGGVEAPLAPLTYGAFSLIKAMSTRNHDPCTASRPFDAFRDGFVMAEGAGMLVLEDVSHAEARGARIYAELLGYGQSNDAFHMTAPRPDGSEAARAIEHALADAATTTHEIDYINAHATGTPLGDAAEACAIRRVFGKHTDVIHISGTKGLYGHALGASGAIEVAITALSLSHACVPGTTNLIEPDPTLPIAVLPPGMWPLPISRALSTSFGFGGVNAALVLGKL